VLAAAALKTRNVGQVLRVHPDRTGNPADQAGFERVQSAWESLRVRHATQLAVAQVGPRA
jgi:hypothetical protein